MMERRTLRIRHAGKPGKEVLPCDLTLSEQQQRWQRIAALQRQRATLDAEEAAAKAKAKAAREMLSQEATTLWREIESNSVERQVACEYLVDVGADLMYVLRLDTMQLVRRRELTRDEKLASRQGDLFEVDAPTRTLDVPSDIETVRRFDGDTADVGQEEDAEDEALDEDGGNGHECTFDDGACLVCGQVEEEVQATKPKRRKRGTGKRATDEGAAVGGL